MRGVEVRPGRAGPGQVTSKAEFLSEDELLFCAPCFCDPCLPGCGVTKIRCMPSGKRRPCLASLGFGRNPRLSAHFYQTWLVSFHSLCGFIAKYSTAHQVHLKLFVKKTSLRGLENSLRKLPYRWPICDMCSQRCNIRSRGAFLPRAFSMVNFVESLRISLLGDNLSELFFMHCQRAVIVYHGPCCQ